jgi:hypothetical protein
MMAVEARSSRERDIRGGPRLQTNPISSLTNQHIRPRFTLNQSIFLFTEQG